MTKIHFLLNTGRTHRSNQVTAPEYVFLISELAGEQRFASIVAKRLESLVRGLSCVALCFYRTRSLSCLRQVIKLLFLNRELLLMETDEQQKPEI